MQQPNRLLRTLAVLAMTFAVGNQAAAQGPPAQQGQQAEIERLRRELEQMRQQQGQPLLVVPAMQQPQQAPPRVDFDLPMVELAPLLQRVERQSGKQFLVDRRLGSRIYLGTVDEDDVTYPVLLAILRANGFAAFESEGLVNIVPDSNIRFHGPVVQADDASIPADSYITRVITPVNIQAVQLVPILRPLLPQAAHLAAHDASNQLLVSDRYESVQRVTEIVRLLDVPPRN